MKELENITTFVLKQDGTIHIDNIEEYLKCCDIVEKKLKALEIIKNKNVDIDWYCGLASFTPHHDILTDEEYNLLKEVLI